MTQTNPSPRPTRPGPRLLRLCKKTQLTPNLLRLTLDGDLRDFGPGSTCKLLIVPRGTTEIPQPQRDTDGHAHWPDPTKRPVVRTFTVCALDREAGELTVDVVLHDGFAAQWALNAQTGDPVGVAGPMGSALPLTAGPYLFVGDHCALPPLAPDTFAWAACESASTLALRAHLRGERSLPPRQMRLMGYWKRGVDERTYHDTVHYDEAPDEYRGPAV